MDTIQTGMLARVATSCSQKNGTVQDPKGRSLRPDRPKNEAKGRGGGGILGDGAASGVQGGAPAEIEFR